MTKQNVVLIVMDTARADYVYDNPEVMPNVSTLAEDGTRYTNVFSTASWTLPSHASIFTGMYPSRHGANAENKHLAESRTLASVFQESGYETVGCSNNAWISGSFGFEQGFEKYYRSWQYIQSDDDLGEAGLMNEGVDMWTSIIKRILTGNVLVNTVNGIYAKFFNDRADDKGAERTNKWIREWVQSRDSSRPFFLFINYLEPHLEYRPPAEYAERFLGEASYQEAMQVPQNAWKYITNQVEMSEEDFGILRSLYKAELNYLDEKIGAFVNDLKNNDEWDNTICIIVGDHGENIGEFGMMDHQYCLYDTLIHVPMIITGGGVQSKGDVDKLIQLCDVYPTLVDEVGITGVEKDEIQGVSFHEKSEDERVYAVSEYIGPQPSREAIEKRVGDPYNVMDKYDRSLKLIRDNQYKYIKYSDGTEELYIVDEEVSAEQEVDLGEHVETARRLREELSSWENSFETAQLNGEVNMSEQTRATLEDLGYLQ
jgi:arylsulfatase A-like enzyme